MALKMEFTVIAVHGEGDRDTVNRIEEHRRKLDYQQLRATGAPIPARLEEPVNEPPDVVVVLRDPTHDCRIEWTPKTWDEIEEWKRIIGYDDQKRHWKHGTVVKVTVSDD